MRLSYKKDILKCFKADEMIILAIKCLQMYNVKDCWNVLIITKYSTLM